MPSKLKLALALGAAALLSAAATIAPATSAGACPVPTCREICESLGYTKESPEWNDCMETCTHSTCGH